MPTRFSPKLRRTATERRALWRNQVTSLFKHERIKTTLPKAKALMRVADEMITLAKRGTIVDFKKAKSFIIEPMMLRKCFTEFAQRYKFRPGGYTRVVRTFNRRIDHAPMAYIELVDRPQEFRPAKAVNYLTAVEQKLVPPPIAPIITPRDLKVASMISPSTSNRVTLMRPHWRKIQPDHVIYYPDYIRKTSAKKLPLYVRRFRTNLEKVKAFKQKLYAKYGQESVDARIAQQEADRFKAIRYQTQRGLI